MKSDGELLDYFAGLAMAGQLASGGLARAYEAGVQNARAGGDIKPPYSAVADGAYVMARAMVVARKRHFAEIEQHPELLAPD
jgi:hypothetical protein